jgi:6-phosphogluconolactonase
MGIHLPARPGENLFSNTISAFAIDTASGALTPLGTPIPTLAFPRSIVVDPSGRFAYVTSEGSAIGGATVSAFAMDAASGALTPIGMPVPTGDTPFSLTINGTPQ